MLYRYYYLNCSSFRVLTYFSAPGRNRPFEGFKIQLFRFLSSESTDNEKPYANISTVSVSKIRESLTACNIQFSDGFTNIIAKCNSCNEQRLFINKTSGFCICHGCGKTGSWTNGSNLKLDRNSLVSLQENESIHLGRTSWKSLKNSLVKPSRSLSQTQLDILKKCNFKKLPLALLERLDARFDEEKEELYFPLKNLYYDVGYKRISKEGETTFPPVGGTGVVLDSRGKDSAVLVPTLRDLAALAVQDNLSFDIIALPYGQQKLPQEVLPLFEKYKEIVLWFDNDSASWDNIRVFAKKLKEDRCFLVSPGGNQGSAVKALDEGLDLCKVVSSAQSISHPSIITFSSLRQDVMFDLLNIDKVSGVKWQRFPVLNNTLKGHRRGELTIMTGSTGCGKTTFMSEYSLDLAMQGVNTLWGSFEIRNERLARTMLQQYALAPLQKNLEKFDLWADRFQQLPLYFMTFHGQQSLDLVMQVVEHATYVHDISHVIIDNVQFMLGLSTSESGFLDRFYRQDALIGAFRNFATKANCHVTLVIHPRKEKEGEMLSSNSIFGGAKASQEADNVLIMQTKTLSSLKVKKYLQIAKNRYSGDLGLMPLEFDPSVLSFSQNKSKES